MQHQHWHDDVHAHALQFDEDVWKGGEEGGATEEDDSEKKKRMKNHPI